MYPAQRSAVLVEDEPLTRALLESLLKSLNFDVTAVDAAADAIDALRECDPDLLLTDLDLGDGPAGTHIIRWAQEHAPWVAVVVLTAHRDLQLADPDIKLRGGGRVHLVKSDVRSATDLQSGIDAAMNGTGFALNKTGEAYVLTSDQAEVLRLVALGYSNKEIARIRQTSLGAVENLLQRIYHSLQLTGDSRINPRARAIVMYRTSQVTVA